MVAAMVSLKNLLAATSEGELCEVFFFFFCYSRAILLHPLHTFSQLLVTPEQRKQGVLTEHLLRDGPETGDGLTGVPEIISAGFL